ncbi:MAG: hypothetical protein Q9P01_13215 [Anaerolineae bacterium]|nr:hypothetical protein [Anaerolineae bacterium]
MATLSTSLSGWADETVCESTQSSDFGAASLINPKQPTIVILACPGKHRRVIAPYLGAVLTRLLPRSRYHWRTDTRWYFARSSTICD